MSSIAIDLDTQSETKPIPITPTKSNRNTPTNQTCQEIGTCRSYDESRPVPSFIRSLNTDSPPRSKRRAKSILFGSLEE